MHTFALLYETPDEHLAMLLEGLVTDRQLRSFLMAVDALRAHLPGLHVALDGRLATRITMDATHTHEAGRPLLRVS